MRVVEDTLITKIETVNNRLISLKMSYLSARKEVLSEIPPIGTDTLWEKNL